MPSSAGVGRSSRRSSLMPGRRSALLSGKHRSREQSEALDRSDVRADPLAELWVPAGWLRFGITPGIEDPGVGGGALVQPAECDVEGAQLLEPSVDLGDLSLPAASTADLSLRLNTSIRSLNIPRRSCSMLARVQLMESTSAWKVPWLLLRCHISGLQSVSSTWRGRSALSPSCRWLLPRRLPGNRAPPPAPSPTSGRWVRPAPSGDAATRWCPAWASP